MLLLCIKIFFVRIIDVSLGTVRTLFTVKDRKLISAVIGFFEVLVWFLVVREALASDESSMYVAIAYALGFATGTYTGGVLAEKFITGNISVQVFIGSNKSIVEKIREAGYGVTAIQYKGIDGDEDKYMLYINIDKKSERKLRNLINSLDEAAFFVENEATYVENGYFK